MVIGRVVGSVWATKKLPQLTGQALLLVAPEGHQGPTLVCCDRVGAGEGERVLVSRGSAARQDLDAPVDAAIVAILDSVDER